MIVPLRGGERPDPPIPMVRAERTHPGNRVLVPVIWGQSAAPLLSIGDAIAGHCPSRGVVLGLVEIPSRWSGLVTSAMVRSRELLQWIASNDYALEAGRRPRLSIQSRYTSDPAASIREALLETQCDTVLAELPPSNSRRRHRLEGILRSLADDLQVSLVMARPDPAASRSALQPRSVLVPLRGGPNAWLALRVGTALASWSQARLTLMHVFNPRDHHALRKHEREAFHELVDSVAGASPAVVEVVSGDPAEAILDIGGDYDAVVMGAHSNPSRAGMLVGRMLSVVISRLTKTVILTRAGAGLRHLA